MPHLPLTGITTFRNGTGRNGTGQLRGLLTNLRDGTVPSRIYYTGRPPTNKITITIIIIIINNNNRAVLWNSRVLWPNCSLFLFNCYGGWAPLVITDSAEILYSKEGVTQGDPLSMFIYAVATIPMINGIGRPTNGTDVWYADDASALCSIV